MATKAGRAVLSNEEKKEKVLSLVDFQIGLNHDSFYSSKNAGYFMGLWLSGVGNFCVEKVFKLAVERNKIKRRIKEILGRRFLRQRCYYFFCI